MTKPALTELDRLHLIAMARLNLSHAIHNLKRINFPNEVTEALQDVADALEGLLPKRHERRTRK